MYDFMIDPFPVTLPNFTIYTGSRKPEVDRIIFNNPATIVFWKDGTKTVVKVSDGETYSPYYGFLAALAKKIYGSNSAIQRIVKQFLPEEEPHVSRRMENTAVPDVKEPEEEKKEEEEGTTASGSFFDQLLDFLNSLTEEEENEE